MANAFSKEQIVMFEDVLDGFEDQLVISKAASVYRPANLIMERTNNQIWRPMPYIAQSFNGLDQTANFQTFTQLSVPVTLGFQKSVPGTMSATEMRDPLQLKRIGDSAKQKLASDINFALFNTAATLGSVVVKRTTAATGFDDVAAADAALTEIGVGGPDRTAIFSPRDMNSMASNLAGRQTLTSGITLNAYERAKIAEIAGFDILKNDQTPVRLAAATATSVTITNTNPLFYTPRATSTATTGETANVDNRFQTISIAVGGSTVKAGDCFTITGVNSVHMITKQDTGQLKTFRVVSITTGAGGTGTIVITPPIISGGGGTAAELEYKNVAATPANGAPLVFLNTVTAAVNPFFHRDSLELITGEYLPPSDAGMKVLKATTENGITITYTMQASINDLSTKYRWDCYFGTACLNTEMCGIELFSQT